MYGLTEAQDSRTLVILIISTVVTHVLSLQTLHFLPLVSALHFFHFPFIFINIQILAQTVQWTD
jgi:uncharacterized membrane protein